MENKRIHILLWLTEIEDTSWNTTISLISATQPNKYCRRRKTILIDINKFQSDWRISRYKHTGSTLQYAKYVKYAKLAPWKRSIEEKVDYEIRHIHNILVYS